jgi:hypothetical protein
MGERGLRKLCVSGDLGWSHMVDASLQALSAASALTCLDLQRPHFTESQLAALARLSPGLQQLRKLKILDDATGQTVAVLANSAIFMPGLQKLYMTMASWHPGDVPISPIWCKLGTLTCLTKLRLPLCETSGSGAELGAQLCMLSQLQRLDLFVSSMQPTDASALASSMSCLVELTNLVVTADQGVWNADFVRGFSAAVAELRDLRTLQLHGFDSQAAGLPLTAALSSLHGLQDLDFFKMKLHTQAVALLGRNISVMTELSSLRAVSIGLCPDNVACWGQGMGALSNLVALDIGANRMDNEGVQMICPAIARLTGLGLSLLSIREAADAVLGPALARLKHLMWLDLGYNFLYDNGVCTLLPHLAPLSELQELHLNENSMTAICKQTLRARLVNCKWMANDVRPFGCWDVDDDRAAP